ELDAAWFIHAVHVPEDQGGNVATVFAGAQCVDDLAGVFDGRVELLVDLGSVAVFFPTDDTDFDFQNLLVELGAFQQLFGDAHVLRYGLGRTVPHVRVEDRVAASFDFGFGGVHERDDPVVELVAHRVIGVDG